MKLDKAIEILNHLELPLKTAEDHDNHLAVRLGIEALKRIRLGRDTPSGLSFIPLPGETAE